MTQFHEGQDVEVREWAGRHHQVDWRKAKIVRLPRAPNALDDGRKYETTLGFFDATHIRAVNPDLEHAPESMPGGGFL